MCVGVLLEGELSAQSEVLTCITGTFMPSLPYTPDQFSWSDHSIYYQHRHEKYITTLFKKRKNRKESTHKTA